MNSYKMTVEYDVNNCVFLNHKRSIDVLYESTAVDDSIKSYELCGKLFCILNLIKQTRRKRKRPHDSGELPEEARKLKQLYEKFITEIPYTLRENISSFYTKTNISDVRVLAQHLFENTIFNYVGINGGNNSDKSVKCKIKDEHFLIPPSSRFFCGCVKDQCLKLDGNKYDILIADPPWWNKYIRRLKGANNKLSYSMMYNEDIASIPVKNLLAPNCLVAVWCTNSPSNIDAVKKVIFPQWGVTYLTTWYWLKITVELLPLRPFATDLNTQPYERLMIGKVGDVDVPEHKLFISVPSALHSHKPPLTDLLKAYVKSENPKTLELFARYLLPNTTSVGYEPLKWQHLSLYDEVSCKNNEK